MSTKKRVLGDKKVLNEDLIDIVSKKVRTTGELIQEIPVKKIIEKENVRKEYDPQKLEELADSIRRNGQLYPILITQTVDGYYDLVYGYRRRRAMLLLDERFPGEYLKINCIVKKKGDLTADKIQELQIVENLLRVDLSPKDLREGLKYFRDQGLTNKEIGKKISKTEGYVKNLFMAVKVLNEDKELNRLIESHPGVTLKDIQAIKPLPKKEQIQLIEQKIEGKIKTRAELEEKVSLLRNQLSNQNTKTYNAKQNYDIVTYKENAIKVKSFSYDFKKTTPEQTQKLVILLKDLISRIQGGKQ